MYFFYRNEKSDLLGRLDPAKQFHHISVEKLCHNFPQSVCFRLRLGGRSPGVSIPSGSKVWKREVIIASIWDTGYMVGTGVAEVVRFSWLSSGEGNDR